MSFANALLNNSGYLSKAAKNGLVKNIHYKS